MIGSSRLFVAHSWLAHQNAKTQYHYFLYHSRLFSLTFLKLLYTRESLVLIVNSGFESVVVIQRPL